MQLLVIAFLCWSGVAAWLYFTQSSLLYYPDLPTREIVTTPQAIGLDYADVNLQAADGTKLHAWFVPADAARGAVLVSHGNAGNISHRLATIRLFNQLGLDVLIYDYRGFGQSEGEPGEDGSYRDAQAAWDYLVEQRGIAPQRIILFGRSLGAAITADLASKQPAAGVILESAFTSVPDMAAELYPWLPARQLARYRYNSLEKVGRIGSPLLVVHSPDDDIIPYAHGERLYAAAGEPRQFYALRGGHNDGFHVSLDGYREVLADFLDRYLPPS